MPGVMARELGVTGGDARILASVGVDLHVTPIVNGVMGVHAELRDDAFK
jgi:acetamidase/formamidase